jgi:hypothetical protein
MLENRVDPFGRIILSAARGSLMGNRGVIHNERKQIVRPFKHKAWIICQLEFKGRKRVVMTPNRWTELFFLDEATALAAGHRPCFECRREAASRFKWCWIHGNPEYNFTMSTRINAIDEIIHRERTQPSNEKVRSPQNLSDIPDGTFLETGNEPFLFHNGRMHRWTPFGYEGCVDGGEYSALTILTSKSIVNAMIAGYVPAVNLPGESLSLSSS